MSVACGNKTHDRDLSKVHHHDSVAQVRLCYSRPQGLSSMEEADADEYGHQQALAEIEAEKRNERWFEERGGGEYAGSQEEARDRYYDSLSWEQAVATEQPGQQVEAELDDGDSAPPDGPTSFSPFLSTGTARNYLLPLDWRDGIYTIETSSGHRTFRFRTQDKTSNFKPGVQIVSYLSGPSNDFARGDWTQFAETKPDHGSRVTKVWVKHRGNKSLEADYLTFLDDPAAADVAVHCKRCRELLTVPESIAAGFGPVCAKKGLR